MKTLRRPERCQVDFRHGRICAVRFRGKVWRARETRDIYVLHDPWRALPGLEGERRVYHLVSGERGEVLVFQTTHGKPDHLGWWVAGWWD